MSLQDLPTWDLSPLYASLDDPRLGADIEAVAAAARSFRDAWKGRVAALDGPGLRDAAKAYEAVGHGPLRPYAFAQLLFAADSENPAHVALLRKIQEVATEAERETLFFPLEVDAIPDDAFDAMARSGALTPYTHFLSQSRAMKPHRLTEPEEGILTLKDLASRSAFVQLYSQVTSAYRFSFTLDGEDKVLTGSEILALLKHPDRGVRRRALETYAARYEQDRTVVASVWNALVLDHRQNLELRRFPDPMAPVHLGNELSATAVDSLMEVTRRNYPLARRYYRWKAGKLGVDRPWSSDLVAPLPGGEPPALAFDTARAWVLEAYSAFHPRFGDIARAFFEETRVDAPPRPGKRGGAFCMGVAPDLPVYVLMNHTGKLRDAATLAHELGHGVHFTLAAKQPLLEYSPVLPLAETASVFGELLLTRRLLAEDLDPAARRNLLCERVEDILATTFRQAMYTDFELRAHRAGAGGYLSPESLCDLWAGQLEELYGGSVETLPASRWAWSAIPHFIHTRFYCYAYVFGELLVLALYRRYRQEGEAFAPKMIELLEAGGSAAPGTIAAGLGYDLEDPGFWAGGYEILEEMIEELGG